MRLFGITSYSLHARALNVFFDRVCLPAVMLQSNERQQSIFSRSGRPNYEAERMFQMYITNVIYAIKLRKPILILFFCFLQEKVEKQEIIGRSKCG